MVFTVGIFVFSWLFLGLSACFGQTTLLPQAPAALEARLSGQSCQIYEDSAHIPHLHAPDELSAIACMGYVHARDRAWQMDFLRRTAEGRTAELLGKESIPQDFQMRLLGLSEKAHSLFAKMTEDQRARLWAYAHGVNRGLNTPEARTAYEFEAYQYQPARWRPEHSLELLLLESLDQTRDTFERRIREADWLQRFKDQAPRLFSHDDLPWETTILKPGEYERSSTTGSPGASPPQTSVSPEIRRVLPELAELFSTSHENFKGSNNWVVAPSRSHTGHAWLANDPHLDLKSPPFWYWVHVAGGDLEAMGASIPGIPTIPSGVNRNVAWGLTNAYIDVADASLVPAADLKGARTYRPVIWFKAGGVKLPFFLKTFQRTAQGWPVLPLGSVPKGKALVIRWTGYDLEPEDIQGLFDLLKSRNVAEADQAFAHDGVPTWNFVFADDQGRIGYRACGRLVRHESALPFGLRERRLSVLEDFPILTAEEAPHLLHPARGYVVTANNRHWPSDARFNEGRAYANPYRAHRIEELITGQPRHDLDSLRRIQCDVQSQDARYLRSAMIKLVQEEGTRRGGLTPRDLKAVELLLGWDLESPLGCRACGVWDRWVQRLTQDAHLNSEALYHALNGGGVPTLPEAALRSFRAALDDLKVGNDGQVRSWGELHRNPFVHLSGDPRFKNDSIPTPGMDNTVNPGTSNWDEKLGIFSHFEGASQRMIVELTSPPEIHQILPGTEKDLDRPSLAEPGSPWMRWAGCELERREFPINWQQVPLNRIAL